MNAFRSGDVHVFRLPNGSDIVEELERFARDHDIATAWFSFLGAVSRAGLRYYDQDAKEYRDFTIDRHLEVLSGVGNVSLLDGAPFVHAHAAFADSEGRSFGGHLDRGCTVWALEVRLEELEGAPLVRIPDPTTGLAVWEVPDA